MKNLMIAALLCSAAATATAQQQTGKVLYERKLNMHKRMPPEAEQFKAMVPEFQTSKVELLYNASQSLLKPAKDEDAELPETGDNGGGGMRRFMRMGANDNAITYRNYETDQIVESRELGPKTYLIEDTLKSQKWKLEEDTLTINGWLCHKATTTTERTIMGMRMGRRNADSSQQAAPPQTQKVTAWYADKIESKAGPDNYFGLPGLILKLDIDEGVMVYTALSIQPTEKETIKAPTNGKKIGRDEFRKLAQQEFRGMRGGGQGGTRRGTIIQQ